MANKAIQSIDGRLQLVHLGETLFFGIMIATLSLMFFIGAVFFARFKAIALKLSASTDKENSA